MARGAQSTIEARSGGSANNGGGFCYSGPTYPTDLASTNGTSSTPSVTSASYTFVAGDVGNWLYIKSGTSWTPGLYQIASVAGGAATLSKAVGTSATLSGGTWAVDYTQQAAAQFSGTDLAVDAVTNTKVTSATHTFTQADVGNWIRVSAGTGWTVGWYQINSVASGAATLDSSPAAVGTTGGTWAEGGAVLLTTMPSCMVAQNNGYVKDGGWASVTASIDFSSISQSTPTSTLPAPSLTGYTTTRNDGGQVSLTLATNAGINCLKFGVNWIIQGFNVNCSSLSASIGIYLNAGCLVRNCKVSNFTGTGGIYAPLATACEISYCEATGGSSASTAAVYGNGAPQLCVLNCWIHDNACAGAASSSNGPHMYIGNIVSNNTGASSDGISVSSSTGLIIEHNTIYKNGRHGIFLGSATKAVPLRIRNNIITDHTAVGAAGLKQTTAAWPADPDYDGNFYYNNSTHRMNVDDCNPTTNSNSTYINSVYLSGVYTNVFDVFLTATPFTSPATNDFTLNNNAGGGAAVRGKGYPGVGGTTYSGIPGLTQTGYPDGGAYQHQDSPATTTYIINQLVTQVLVSDEGEY